MKRIAALTFALVFIAAFCVAAGAQTQMTPQMCTNISCCADMMQQMAEALKSGKLSPAESKVVISHMNQMGRIMQEMTGPSGPSLEQKHAQELQQIKEKWDRLREMKKGLQVKPGH